MLLMFYSIATSIGIVQPLGNAKASVTFIYAVFCFAITFWNFRRMQHDAHAQKEGRMLKEQTTHILAEGINGV